MRRLQEPCLFSTSLLFSLLFTPSPDGNIVAPPRCPPGICVRPLSFLPLTVCAMGERQKDGWGVVSCMAADQLAMASLFCRLLIPAQASFPEVYGIGCIVGVSPSWSAFAKSRAIRDPDRLASIRARASVAPTCFFAVRRTADGLFLTVSQLRPDHCSLARRPMPPTLRVHFILYSYPTLHLNLSFPTQRRIMHTIS